MHKKKKKKKKKKKTIIILAKIYNEIRNESLV